MDREKEKILDITKEQIEKKFGFRLVRSLSMPLSASAAYPAVASLRSTALSRPARRRWHCKSSRRPKRPAALPPSSTPSTRSIPAMPRDLASTSTRSSSRSQTRASRRSRSATCWCAAVP
jgi:hypothetical protein